MSWRVTKKENAFFFSDKTGKIIIFNEDKWNKCAEMLNARIKFNLKYKNVKLSDEYYKQCYSSPSNAITVISVTEVTN